MSTIALVGTAITLFLGSFIQRVTGMGLALVAAPFLTVILGAVTGVQTLQVVGLGVCAASAIALRSDVNLRRAGVLLVASAIGLVPGVVLTRSIPTAWLGVGVGVVTLVMLASTSALSRAKAVGGTRAAAAAGALSGFFNVTAGVGGPPIVIYARSTGWEYREYLATVQLFFAGLNVLSIAGRGIPQLSVAGWAVAGVAAVAGTMGGHYFGKHINDNAAKSAVFVIACVGSAAAVVKGIAAL